MGGRSRVCIYSFLLKDTGVSIYIYVDASCVFQAIHWDLTSHRTDSTWTDLEWRRAYIMFLSFRDVLPACELRGIFLSATDQSRASWRAVAVTPACHTLFLKINILRPLRRQIACAHRTKTPFCWSCRPYRPIFFKRNSPQQRCGWQEDASSHIALGVIYTRYSTGPLIRKRTLRKLAWHCCCFNNLCSQGARRL